MLEKIKEPHSHKEIKRKVNGKSTKESEKKVKIGLLVWPTGFFGDSDSVSLVGILQKEYR